MVIKAKQTRRSSRPIKSAAHRTSKFSISVVHEMRYPSIEGAKAAKAVILKKVAHAKFSALQKTGKSVKFLTKTTYIKSLPSGLSTKVIAAHIKATSPGSGVIVKKVS